MLFFEDALYPKTSSLWSDRKIRAMVEDLLTIRREAEAGNPPSLHDAYLAAAKGARLLEALLSCVAAQLGIRVSLEDYASLPDAEKRSLMAKTLSLGLPILQPKACTEWPLTIEAVNAGYIAPLLQKTLDRKGRAPDLAAYAEFEMLKWIRWRHGLGHRVADAEGAVAEAIVRTVAAVQKWYEQLPKVYGKDRFWRELDLAERVGQYEQSGRDWTEMDPRESDDSAMLHRAASNLVRDLDELAFLRRAATKNRGQLRSGARPKHHAAERQKSRASRQRLRRKLT